MKESNLFPLVIALTLVTYAAQSWLSRPPQAVPESAPASDFSAGRAVALLEYLLQENQPHPVGSDANMLVQSRIVAWLDEAGIEHEIQAGWGCASKRNNCAWVENVIGWLPGAVPGRPAVALMAHYDSVPVAPGAGDDMAGVVAVLESARALQARGPHANPVLLVITDAEETGLLGAEAFFKFHPRASDIGVILNVDGSGTTGSSLVLRTAMANATFMAHYRAAARYPSGASLANEVFRRMANDTDFSVSARAGVPGIDFAFSGERNHYHTPNDNAVNLDTRLVQHHGENILPTALRLANADLTRMASGKVVYNGIFGTWVQWPANVSKWLLVLTFILLATSAYRLPLGYVRTAAAATIVPLAIFLVSSGLAYAMFMLLDLIIGTRVNWPAHLWPFRTVVFATMFTAALLISLLSNRRIGLPDSIVGVWWFWWLLSAILVAVVPDAANVFLVPLVPAAILLCIATWRRIGEPGRHLLYLATLIGVVPLLWLALLMEDSQGYGLVVAMLPWIAMYALTAGVFARGPQVKPAIMAGLILLVVSLVAASLLPLYSEWRPQHVNIDYVQDSDKQVAHWRLRAAGPPPATITAHADFSLPDQPLYPWLGADQQNLARAAYASMPAPALTMLMEEPLDAGRRVTLSLASLRGANFLQLALPAGTPILRYRVGGNEVEPIASTRASDAGVYRLVFYGVQSRDVTVSIDFENTEPVLAYLLDSSTTLPPAAAPMLAARPPLATPVHSGDASLVFKTFRF